MFKSLLVLAAAYVGYKYLDKNGWNNTLKLTPPSIDDVNPAEVFIKPTAVNL